MTADLPRRLAAESIGTAMLLAAVVGSGIMADRLSGGNDAIALLANTIATAAALAALILTFGPISGAHFNPAVSIADASQGGLRWQDVPAYVLAQVLGAVLGVWTAHVMFGERAVHALRPCAERSRATGQRVRRDVRPGVGDLGMFAAPGGRRPRCDRRVHRRCILVHGVDVVCEPGRHACTRADGYVRRHSSRRRAGIHRRAARGRGGRHAPLSVARADRFQGRPTVVVMPRSEMSAS